MPDWLQELAALVGKDGAWAAFCLILLVFLAWFASSLFKLQGQTIEVMTAIRTLIENLECRGGNKP